MTQQRYRSIVVGAVTGFEAPEPAEVISKDGAVTAWRRPTVHALSQDNEQEPQWALLQTLVVVAFRSSLQCAVAIRR